MSQDTFYLDDIPMGQMIDQYLADRTGLHTVAAKMKPKVPSYPIVTVDAPWLNVDRLHTSCIEAFEKFGWFGFHVGVFNQFVEERFSFYGGTSLTYNPNYNYPTDPHASSLGEPRKYLGNVFASREGDLLWKALTFRGLLFKFFKALRTKTRNEIVEWLKLNGLDQELDLSAIDFDKREKIDPNCVKNSYSDTYGFSWRTDASNYGYIGELLEKSKLTLIRSRIATLKAWLFLDKEFNWHRDESPFINLRVNIPVNFHPKVQLEISDQFKGPLKPGKLYTWDTSLPHRVFAEEPVQFERVNLVLGFSPWFTFDPENRCWRKNEFWGEVHPFDMIAEGHVFPWAENCHEQHC